MDDLIGQTITKVEIGDDSTVMVFTTKDDKQLAYYTDGDCCSKSWFSALTGLGNLLNQKVVSVEERQEFSEEDQERAETEYRLKEGYEPESIVLYGYMIRTKKGTCDIEFRNHSNGYYGGWCEKSSCIPEDLKEVKEVKEDF